MRKKKMKNKFKKEILAKNTLSKYALLEHIVKGNSRVVRGIDTHDFLLEQLLGRTKEKEQGVEE
jgi:hypothetical protein